MHSLALPGVRRSVLKRPILLAAYPDNQCDDVCAAAFPTYFKLRCAWCCSKKASVRYLDKGSLRLELYFGHTSEAQATESFVQVTLLDYRYRWHEALCLSLFPADFAHKRIERDHRMRVALGEKDSWLYESCRPLISKGLKSIEYGLLVASNRFEVQTTK